MYFQLDMCVGGCHLLKIHNLAYLLNFSNFNYFINQHEFIYLANVDRIIAKYVKLVCELKKKK
jgi:hypothetical protein